MSHNKWLFLGTVVTGIILLIVLRLLFASPVLLTVLVLCLLIAAYAVTAWHYRHFYEEGAADNLYYIGFIFTVCTLGVSLYRFSTQENELASIVGDLGTGLITTVLGLILRVFFLASGSSKSEQEERVRVELVEVAEDTIRRIRMVADIVEEGQIAMRHAIEEMNSSIKAASTTLAASTNQLEERISTVTNIPPDLLSSQLSPALASAFQSIISFADQVYEIDIPDDLVISRINQLFARVTETIEEGQTATRQAIDRMNTSIKAATTKLVANAERLDERISAAINVPSDMVSSRLSPALDNASQSITRFAKQVDNIVISDDLVISRINQLFARVTESIEEGQTATRQAIDGMNTSIKTATEELVANAGRLDERISAAINVPSDMVSSRLSPALDNASQSITGFAKQVDNIVISDDFVISCTNQFTRLAEKTQESLIERFQSMEIPSELLTERIGPALDEINSSTRVFVERMQNLSSSLEDIQQKLIKCNNQIASLGIKTIDSPMKTDTLTDILSEISALNKNLESLLKKPEPRWHWSPWSRK